MCEANLPDPNARLEKLFETCAAENGYTNFKRASEAREPILLILDGINEATQAPGTVNDIAQWLRTEFDTASVLVADRMTPRGTYPNEYKLATLLPLSSEIVQSVLSEPEQAGNGTEGAFSRMLRLPFFLDLYRGDPSGSRRMDLLIRYVHRMLVGDRMSDPTVSYEAPSVIKLAGIAFDGYQQTRTPGISVEVLRSVSAGTLELTPERLRGSGLMRSPEEFGTQSANPSPTGGILVFRHQLIQDSLAAWHFVRGEFRPEPQHLQTLTLDRQSSDALVLALETPGVRANTLMIGVYDWDHPIALSCLLETRTDPKETLATAICAVIAQKKHDRFLHTRLRIEGSLSALRRFLDIREDFTSEELLQYVIGMEERFQGTDLSKWWRVFTSREASDEVWRALTGRDDPLSRWAAAATLRRMDLRPYELPLKQLYYALRSNEAPDQPSPTRWRLVHAMGQLNSSNELLEGAVWDAGENRDVRYGAARSQIEVAIRSPESRGAEILKSIAEKLRSVEASSEDKNLLRAIKEFRSCAILDRKKSAEPGWWHEAYLPILQAGIRITAQLSAEENRRWTAQLERFVSDVRDLSD